MTTWIDSVQNLLGWNIHIMAALLKTAKKPKTYDFGIYF